MEPLEDSLPKVLAFFQANSHGAIILLIFPAYRQVFIGVCGHSPRVSKDLCTWLKRLIKEPGSGSTQRT